MELNNKKRSLESSSSKSTEKQNASIKRKRITGGSLTSKTTDFNETVAFAPNLAYEKTYEMVAFKMCSIKIIDSVHDKKAYVYLCMCGEQCKITQSVYKCAKNACGFVLDIKSAQYFESNHLYRKLEKHNIPLCNKCQSVRIMVPLTHTFYAYGIPTYICSCKINKNDNETQYFVSKDHPELMANYHWEKLLELIPKKKDSKGNVIAQQLKFQTATLDADEEDDLKSISAFKPASTELCDDESNVSINTSDEDE